MSTVQADNGIRSVAVTAGRGLGLIAAAIVALAPALHLIGARPEPALTQ